MTTALPGSVPVHSATVRIDSVELPERHWISEEIKLDEGPSFDDRLQHRLKMDHRVLSRIKHFLWDQVIPTVVGDRVSTGGPRAGVRSGEIFQNCSGDAFSGGFFLRRPPHRRR